MKYNNDNIIAKKSDELASKIKKLQEQRLSLEMSCVLTKSDKGKLNDIFDEINGVNKKLFKCYGITKEILDKITNYNAEIKKRKEEERKQQKLMRKQELEENRRQRELCEEEQKEKTDNVVDISKTHIILAQRSKRFTSQR